MLYNICGGVAMINKELLNRVIDTLTDNNQIEHIRKISDINGLSQAYSITQNQDILEESFNQTLELIIAILENETKNKKVIKIDKEFEEIRMFLKNKGISEDTSAGYVRAIKRVMKNEGFETFEELCLNLEQVILKYNDGQDRKYHNIHLSSLRWVNEFIYDIKENKCFYVVFQLKKDQHLNQTTFDVLDRSPLVSLKEASIYSNNIQDSCSIKPQIYYSDKQTIVPKSKIQMALNY